MWTWRSGSRAAAAAAADILRWFKQRQHRQELLVQRQVM
jgi:hypothetical protein